jgi:hypothetical protein
MGYDACGCCGVEDLHNKRYTFAGGKSFVVCANCFQNIFMEALDRLDDSLKSPFIETLEEIMELAMGVDFSGFTEQEIMIK